MEEKLASDAADWRTELVIPEDESEELEAADEAAEEQHSGSGSDMEEEEEEEVDSEYETPAGFLGISAPAELIKDARGLYVCMLWNPTGWEVGSVQRYSANRSRHNYDILWAGERYPRGSKLCLKDYFVQLDVGAVASATPFGAWLYVQKAPQVAGRRDS